MMDKLSEFIDSALQMIQSLIQSIAAGLPSFLGAIAILVIGWFVAKYVGRGIAKLLNTLQVDTLMDKLRTVSIFASVRIQLSTLLGELVRWIIFLIVLIVGSETLGLRAISDNITQILTYLPKLLSALAFFAIGTFAANIIRKFIQTTAESFGISTGRFIAGFVFYFLLVMIGISALNQAGINTEIISENLQIILSAVLFSLALGYGLGSRHLMANLLGSFYIKGKLELGQVIKIDGVEGIIIAADSTSVTLKTVDKIVLMPLSKFTEQKIEIISIPPQN